MARLIDNLPERPPNRDIRQVARVLRFLWPYRARMAVAGVALVGAAGFGAVPRPGLERGLYARFPGNDPPSRPPAPLSPPPPPLRLAPPPPTPFYSGSLVGVPAA